jgi:hypothetical protein
MVMTFLGVKAASPHNIIIGRPGMFALGWVVSTIHVAMKFTTRKGVGMVYADKQCAASQTISQDPEEKIESWSPNTDFPDKKVQIGAAGPGNVKKLPMVKKDIFARQPSDVVGVPR